MPEPEGPNGSCYGATPLTSAIERAVAAIGFGKHGQPTVAMLSWKAYERVQEILATVEVLSDPELVEQIRRGEREIEAGEGIPLEQFTAELGV